MANAGRILILAKGAWEQLTNYVQLDLVTRNGIAYIARRASVGVDPALDVSYTNWMPFGSAAEIATTVSPGLVMPDGTSITVTSTGLIKAVLGIDDLTDVDIENPLTNQVLRYNGTAWTAITLGTAADKSTTNAVTEDSTALVESGAVASELATVNSSITALTNDLAIVENGNTCTHTGGISTGQYVIWKGTLCTAVSNISVGETLTNSGGSKNLKDVNDGGFNDLYSNSLRCVDVPVTITCAAHSFTRQNIAIQTGEETVVSRISVSIIDATDISAGICGYGRVMFFCENAQNDTAATLRIWYTVKRF